MRLSSCLHSLWFVCLSLQRSVALPVDSEGMLSLRTLPSIVKILIHPQS